MASISKRSADGRHGYRIRFYCDGRRREIYLPGLDRKTQRLAETIGLHLDDLAKAKANNIPPAAQTAKWAAGTKGVIRASLVKWGLAEPADPRLLQDAGRLLGPFLDAYVASRTDAKPNTIANYKQVRRLLCEFFGESLPLVRITASDADKWRRWMFKAKNLSSATVSKHCKRAKTLLAEAVRDRLLPESPFAGLRGGDESNPARQHFIDRQMADQIIEACPDTDWRAIFVLARFAGLRCPSEVLTLTWNDIDWSAGRIRIDSPKTGLRFCPLFPEVRAALADSLEVAPDGSLYVIHRYRADQNLRTQFHRILTRAGIVPWAKPFVNLRSSCRTELENEGHRQHVCDAWLGHSTAVAKKHYLQVTDADWQRALVRRSPTGSPITNQFSPIANHQPPNNPSEKPLTDASGLLLMDYPVPPQGLEESIACLENERIGASGPPPGPPSATISQEFRALWECWQALSEDERAEILKQVRVKAH